MSQTTGQTFSTTGEDGAFAAFARGAGALMARVRARRAIRQTQDALGRLDAAVLRDIGVGASSFGPNRPVIEVEAGLMLILTGLR